MQFEALQKEMIKAMKEKDKFRKDSISFLIAAAKKDAIDKGIRENIPEEIVNSAIAKETKMAKEQVDTCPADRTELKAEYEGLLMKSVMPELKGKADGKTINEVVGKVLA